MTSGRARKVLAGLILLGLILRGFYLAEIASHPGFTRPRVDPAYYDYWARALVSGDWTVRHPRTDPEIRDHPFFKPPGYAYLLGLLYLVSSGSYLFPRIFQMILGLGSALAAYHIARKRAGERAALIWAGLMAVYWIFIYYEGELLESAAVILLFLALFGLLLRWSDRPGPLSAALAGLVLGVTALMRPNFLALPAAILPWQFWVLGRRSRRRIFPRSAGIFLLAILLPLAPAAIRNYLVSGEFVPIATYGGVNLHLGNQPGFSPVITHGSSVTGDWSSFEYPRVVRRLEREEGRPMTHSRASSHLAGLAWSWIRENPGLFFRRLGEKTLLFWGPREVTNNKVVEFERLHSRVLRKIPGSFALVLALALAGAALWRISGRREEPRSPRRRMLALLLGLTAVYFLTFLPFIASALYRVPLIPFLLLAGAVGIDVFLDYLRRREWRFAILAAAGFLVLYGLARFNPSGYRPELYRWYKDQAEVYARAGQNERALSLYDRAVGENPSYIQAYYDRGNLRSGQGEYREAIRDYDRALALRADYGPAYNNRGLAYLRGLSDYNLAARDFQRALELDPENPAAYNNLALAYYHQSRYDRAREALLTALSLSPENARARYNLGIVSRAEGNTSEAAAQLRQAVSLDPRYRAAHYSLAETLSETGDFPEAVRHYLRAIEIEPDYYRAYSGLGQAYSEMGMTEEAVRALHSARDLNPESAGVRHRLAVILTGAGRFPEAAGEYREAVRLDPEHIDAHIGLGVLLGMAGRYEDAEAMLKRAVELDPGSVDGRYNLAVLYRRTGRREDFLEELSNLEKLSPELAGELRKKP